MQVGVPLTDAVNKSHYMKKILDRCVYRFCDLADNIRHAHEKSKETATVFSRSFEMFESFSVLAVSVSRM